MARVPAVKECITNTFWFEGLGFVHGIVLLSHSNISFFARTIDITSNT